MKQAVLLMAGITFFIAGLSYLFRAKEWRSWMYGIEERGRDAAPVLGFISLLVGSFIVAFHPVWQGVPVILTIIGALGIMKGFVYMLFPGSLPATIKFIRHRREPLFRVSGVFYALIALLLLNEWRMQKDILWNETWNGFVTFLT